MKSLLISLIAVFSAIMICFGVSCYYSYFYPFDYREIIVVNAEKYGVDAELVASIINVESSYNPYARSNKGALGLMQVLPSTAEWIAGRLGRDASSIDLFEPSINIQFGTYYIAYLINYFGDENLAICAYNAGMGNVKKWLRVAEYSSDGENLDKIPFKETKKYLKSVQKNVRIYKNKFI